MFLGLLTLLVAISISVIAAYYSIIGLTAIFAAAFLPIVLMGSVLEVGKLLATVWLHQNWRRAPFIMKTYLCTAVVVLMFITSMGVFGFLSKSHIEQSAMGTEQIAQVDVINKKMNRIDAKVNRWSEDILRLNQGGNSGRLDNLIVREQNRIKEANNRIQPQIDAENAKVPGLQAQADKEIAQQNKRLNDAQARTKAEIVQAEKRLAVLDRDVEAYTSQGTTTGGVFTPDVDNVKKGEALRLRQKPERDRLNLIIAKAKKSELGVASAVQREIRKINAKLAKQISDTEKRIEKIRESINSTVASANKNIAKYTNDAGTTNENVDVKIAELERLIESVQPNLDSLREEKFVFEKQYRQFEAEVGPVKYIAELIYGEADRNLLEDAVRWVIIIIVAVFDPLAVCLVLAGTMTIGWWREDRNLNKPKIKEKIIRVEDPRLKELEMQLKKHNEIIDELEKLLDSNMGNIDASEYAKLKAEHDKMIAERDALAKAFDEAKAESGALVDKVVATEQERDTHKVHIDKLVEGAGVFEKRIEDLINQISDLEAEIVRRDQVVLKMAQKYQLIEKDEFGDDLVAQVTDEKKP
jgi:chromosome segregation ATPase